MRLLPTSLLLLPTLLVTDSNLHSPLWNPLTYTVNDASSDTLVKLMTNWGLHLRSPKGVLTYDAKQGMSSGTTIDLFWLNQQADEMLVACLVDSDDNLNHHSNHKAVVIVVSIKCDNECSSRENLNLEQACHKTDHPKFITGLKALLPPPTAPSTRTDIVNLDSSIITAITNAFRPLIPP